MSDVNVEIDMLAKEIFRLEDRIRAKERKLQDKIAYIYGHNPQRVYLSTEHTELIHEFSAQGWQDIRICKIFPISPSTCSRILRGERRAES